MNVLKLKILSLLPRGDFDDIIKWRRVADVGSGSCDVVLWRTLWRRSISEVLRNSGFQLIGIYRYLIQRYSSLAIMHFQYRVISSQDPSVREFRKHCGWAANVARYSSMDRRRFNYRVGSALIEGAYFRRRVRIDGVVVCTVKAAHGKPAVEKCRCLYKLDRLWVLDGRG